MANETTFDDKADVDADAEFSDIKLLNFDDFKHVALEGQCISCGVTTNSFTHWFYFPMAPKNCNNPKCNEYLLHAMINECKIKNIFPIWTLRNKCLNATFENHDNNQKFITCILLDYAEGNIFANIKDDDIEFDCFYVDHATFDLYKQSYAAKIYLYSKFKGHVSLSNLFANNEKLYKFLTTHNDLLTEIQYHNNKKKGVLVSYQHMPQNVKDAIEKAYMKALNNNQSIIKLKHPLEHDEYIADYEMELAKHMSSYRISNLADEL
jgi:hypothetical protein